MKWGTVREREKGMGRKGGGKVSTQATWDQSGRELHHNAKEGFQVSERGSGTGEGFTWQRGIIKGLSRGLCMYLRYNANLVHIVPTVCMSC